MTYLDYLNNFNRWLESNTLPGNAQLMYFRLLNVFNRAGWPEHVQVDTLRLMLLSDSKSEKTARLARDKLVESGFIRFEKGKKGFSTTYYLNDFTEEKRVINTGEKLPGKNYLECYRESGSECGIESCREKGTESSLHNKNNIKKDIKTKNIDIISKEKSKKKAIQIPNQEATGFSDEMQDMLRRWVEYKDEKKNSYVPSGLQTLINRLHKSIQEYGETAVIDMLERTIASNYQGPVWDWLKQKSKPYQQKNDQHEIEWATAENTPEGFIPWD